MQSLTWFTMAEASSSASCWWSLVGIGLKQDDADEPGLYGALYPPDSFSCGNSVCGNELNGDSSAASYAPNEGNGDGPLDIKKKTKYSH